MYFVYALFSRKYKKIYIGYTSDIDQRLLSYNFFEKKGFTVKYRPWILVYKEKHQTKRNALIREKQLKSARGRKFIWDLIHISDL
jgi:putative endonuclease